MNNTKPIGFVFGTRPEVLKLSSVIDAMECLLPGSTWSIDTQQQTQLKDQALMDAKLKPNVQLPITKEHQLTDKLAHMVQHLDRELSQKTLAAVVVQGDTLTTFAGSLAAFYQGIPVLHIEAGLRSGHVSEPFPEEAHRRMISHMAVRHYTPDQSAMDNLLNEGIPRDNIIKVGNPLFDHQYPASPNHAKTDVLVTIHRRENFEHIQQLLSAIKTAAVNEPNRQFLVIKHSQPRLMYAVEQMMQDAPDNLNCTFAMPHQDFISNLKRSALVITDSGGVQEEAAHFAIKTLLVRNHCDRMDGIRSKTIRLIGNQPENMAKQISLTLQKDLNIQTQKQLFSSGSMIAEDILNQFYDLPNKHAAAQ